MKSATAELEGVTFDHYQVLTRSDGSLHELGRGAMGITYKAIDTNLQVPVALKVINTQRLDSDGARQRFVQEARSTAKLRHQHVASVFHLGMEGDTCFYAMEYIDGETVESLIKRRGPLSPRIVLRIGLQVARALMAAEMHKLVHRDIKPANLMLVSAEDELCVKVIDFGLATSVLDRVEADRSDLSSSGFVGTPHYASPEQLEAKVLDSRSDIYALGATFWYMLTGHPPFTGPLARVMSQHLTSPPPLEDLKDVPAPLVRLLARMLAKNPAERPQSAGDLRRELDTCLEAVAGPPGAAEDRTTQEEQAIASEAAQGNSKLPLLEFATRTVVAGRLEVVQRLGETNEGWVFKARDLENPRDVRLLLLRQDFKSAPEAFAQLSQEVERLSGIHHPNLLEVYGLEVLDEAGVIVMEWTQGLTLRELLRVRSELSPTEGLALLAQIAAGVDHAMVSGLQRLDLALHQIHLHLPDLAGSPADLLRTPIDQWPRFVVKLTPLKFTRDVALSETWAGAQTMLNSSNSGETIADPGSSNYARESAVLMYELLGGALKSVVAASVATTGVSRYTPLSNLTEEGNEVLRRAMDPGRGFPRAADFLRALSSVGPLETRHRETGAALVAETETPTLPELPAPRAHPLWPYAIAAVLALSAGAFFLMRPATAPAPTPPTPLPRTPDATPVEIVHEPAPPAATPAPQPPPPDERELLKAAVVSAEQVENKSNLAQSIDRWIDVAQKYPQSEIGRMRLELLLDKVRLRETKLTPTEMETVGPSLREAAKLEVASAMLLLGESLRQSDPAEAFRWFSAAGAKGVPSALTQMGLMYSNGLGVERDLKAAAECFEKAADKSDPAALAALGECYLTGKGVEKNNERAIELLRKAAAKGNVRAMDRLGTCYQQGIGGTKNFAEAARLYTAAADQGYADSIGNLGVLYINGDGVPANPRKAVELFQKGAGMSDGYCMFLYAKCLESGTGIAPSLTEARSWYKRSAEAGFRRAKDWCTQNGVAFTARKTES